jgi:formylglycine-generating enzyme required for sulfatase activity
MEMIYVAPGEFMMGSEDGEDDEKPVHKVTLTKGYWLGKYEVTQRQWESVMGENPSYFKGEDLPVDTVSWDDCRRFVAKLNARFSCDARLPTEREWEYACRASTKTPYSWGPALNGDKANCDGTFPVGTPEKGPYLQKTVPVGSYAPNPWGLYCMHGNVREWCADTYDSTRRVLRGGSWYQSPANCRSASRDGSDPASRYSNFGFRLCCSEGGAAK